MESRLKRLLPLTLIAITSLPSAAEARSFRLTQLPNGGNNCNVCHATSEGGALNPFGIHVSLQALLDEGNLTSERSVVWLNVCADMLDSDGDGYPNGVELGDPQCTWVIGDPNPEFTASNPGNQMSTPCGNGTIEAPYEDCDGISLGGQTCVSIGRAGGILRCGTDCKLDDSACTDTPSNNSTNNATNNQTNQTNNATNNQTGQTQNTNQTGNPTAPEENPDDVEPFFCDGEMDADENYKAGASAIVGLFLVALFRRRLFS